MDDGRLLKFQQCLATYMSALADWEYRFDWYQKLPLKGNRDVEAAIDTIQEAAMAIVQERKAHLNQRLSTASDDAVHLVDLILQASDEENETNKKLSDIEVRDNTVVFLVAGSETTAWALSYFLGNLLKNPAVLAKVRAEVDAFFDSLKETAFDTDLAEERLPYLWQSLKESMRVTPSVLGVVPRVLTKDMTFGGYRIPKDLRIFSLAAETNWNPTDWGANATEFNPDRFAPAEVEKRHPYANITFGCGVRTCIGRQFAEEELRLLLPNLLRRWEFDWADPAMQHKPIEGQLKGLVVHARGDINLVFRPRNM